MKEYNLIVDNDFWEICQGDECLIGSYAPLEIGQKMLEALKKGELEPKCQALINFLTKEW